MKSDSIDFYLNLKEHPYCSANETCWVEALCNKDLYPAYNLNPRIEFRNVQFQIDDNTFITVKVPFKIHAGEETGLAYINGKLSIVHINNKGETIIYRRSALSRGMIDQINQRFPIPNINIKDFSSEDGILDSEWDQYANGLASASGNFLQYQSTIVFLIFSDLPLSNKNQLIEDWLLSLPGEVINDGFIRSVITYSNYIPAIINTLIKKMAISKLEITTEGFKEITNQFEYSTFFAEDLVEIISSSTFPNKHIITSNSFPFILKAILFKGEYKLILRILKDDFALKNLVDNYFLALFQKFIKDLKDSDEIICKIIDLLLKENPTYMFEYTAKILNQVIDDHNLRIKYADLIKEKYTKEA